MHKTARTMNHSQPQTITCRSGVRTIVIMVFLALIVLGAARGARVSAFNSSLQQSNTQDSKQTQSRELSMGQPIERELAAGASDFYSISLTQEQYLKVVVMQKGIDVGVKLFGADGQQIAEVDSPNGTEGPEPLAAIPTSAGQYRIEVRSLNAKGAPGRYEIRLEELRDATAKDRDRIQAEKAITDAEKILAQGTGESHRKALEKYEEALPLFRALGERQREGFTLNRMAVRYQLLGESENALRYHNQALSLRRAIGDQQGEGQSLYNIGSVYLGLGDSQKALDYYQQALPIMQAAGDRPTEAKILNAIGTVYSNLGKLSESIDFHNRALALHRAVGNRLSEAVTLNNMAAPYTLMGEWQKALDYHNQALALIREIGDPRYEAQMLTNIGYLYWQLGENQKALEYHNQALPLRRTTGDRNGEALTLVSIGAVYAALGDERQALTYYDQALALSRALGNRHGEADALTSIGIAYTALGETQKALDSFNQALLLRRALREPLGEAGALNRIGMTYASSGKHAEAVSYLEKALSLQRLVGARNDEAGTLANLARSEQAQGRLAEARTQIEAALNIVEGMRSKFGEQLRTSFSTSTRKYYDVYINLLMQMHQKEPLAGHDVTAFSASERARARSLLDLLAESRTDIRQGVDPALLERERSLQQQLNAKSEQLTRLLSSTHAEERETAARKEVEALVSDYQDVQAQIRAKSPAYAALTQPEPLSLKDTQSLLDNETVLLEYALGEERSYLWVVTPERITSFELPKRADIETAASALYESITARNKLIRFETPEIKQARVRQADAEYFDRSMILSRMLLGPAAALLGKKRMLIVSDGALQYLPFGSLPIPEKRGQPQPLVSAHEIVSLPSASTLALLRKEVNGRTQVAKNVAVIADPVFQDDDPRVNSLNGSVSNHPKGTRVSLTAVERSVRDTGETEFQRLPYSRREAEWITALSPGLTSQMFVDFDANRATATSANLSEYKIIHFATHSLLNSKHPELSGIVLSLVDKSGQPQDGFLRLNEIYNLKLGADLVVLSACRTALGKEVRGEGLVGITRGFMYAGAPRVVASLWAVDDAATAELMKRFYREMLVREQRPAAALRTAQLSLWNEKRFPPYYWAGFVLQGEWK